MRISATRRVVRITLAAVAGVVFAGLGAGVAFADGQSGTPATPTPTPTATVTYSPNGENNPWG